MKNALWKRLVDFGQHQLEKLEQRRVNKIHEQWSQQKAFQGMMQAGDVNGALALIENKKVDQSNIASEFWRAVEAGNMPMAKALMPHTQTPHLQKSLMSSACGNQLDMIELIAPTFNKSVTVFQEAVLMAALRKNWAAVDCLCGITGQPLTHIGWTSKRIQEIFDKPMKPFGRKHNVTHGTMKYLVGKALLDGRQDILELVSPFVAADDKIDALKTIADLAHKSNNRPSLDRTCFQNFLDGSYSSEQKNKMLQATISYMQEDIVPDVIHKFPKHTFDPGLTLRGTLWLSWSSDTLGLVMSSAHSREAMNLWITGIEQARDDIFDVGVDKLGSTRHAGQALWQSAQHNQTSYVQKLMNKSAKSINQNDINHALQWASHHENMVMFDCIYPLADHQACLRDMKSNQDPNVYKGNVRIPINSALLETRMEQEVLLANIDTDLVDSKNNPKRKM